MPSRVRRSVSSLSPTEWSLYSAGKLPNTITLDEEIKCYTSTKASRALTKRPSTPWLMCRGFDA